MKTLKKHIFNTGLFILLSIACVYAKAGNGAITIDAKNLVAPEAVSYQWFYNGEKLFGETTKEIDELKSGTYTVLLNQKNGNITKKQIVVSVEDDTVRRIFVIGDSTASDYSDSSFPRTGWAQVLQPFFKRENVQVINKALSGRSSKSFYTDPSGWPKVLPFLQEGDFLFIQFAHNDEKSDDPDRYTEPYSTFQEYLSIYIDSARAHGAYPVLLTPINRNGWSGAEISDSHGDYPPAMRDLAEEKDVPLIDLHHDTKMLFESLGKAYVTDSIFNNLPENVYNQYPEGNEDNTHLQLNGAYEVSKLVAEEIKSSDNEVLQQLQPSLEDAGVVLAITSPFLHGSVTGKGVYSLGEKVTLSVRPKDGFAVANWSEKDEIVSSAREYTFTLETVRRNIRANMEKGYEVSVEQETNGGFIDGEGFYVEGAEVTLIVDPYDSYQFISWKQDDQTVGTDTSYTFAMGSADMTFTALFMDKDDVLSNRQALKKKVKIFPNPASHFLKINRETKSNNELMLFNELGNIVLRRNISSAHETIDISGIPGGMYILSIDEEKYKLIINQ